MTFAKKEKLNLAPEKSLFNIRTVRNLGHEIGFNTIEPFQYKINDFLQNFVQLQNSNWWGSMVQWLSIPIFLI